MAPLVVGCADRAEKHNISRFSEVTVQCWCVDVAYLSSSVVVSEYSCRSQVGEGTGKIAFHPLTAHEGRCVTQNVLQT
jgi:hypothetical protein